MAWRWLRVSTQCQLQKVWRAVDWLKRKGANSWRRCLPVFLGVKNLRGHWKAALVGVWKAEGSTICTGSSFPAFIVMNWAWDRSERCHDGILVLPCHRAATLSYRRCRRNLKEICTWLYPQILTCTHCILIMNMHKPEERPDLQQAFTGYEDLALFVISWYSIVTGMEDAINNCLMMK